ncbi:MAG: D-alanyl-D-alanine carboxypeptidase [Gallintestinimicrobium sp.]
MEDITHTTARGSTPFTLSSANKLLKQYQWATGLKTGSTAKAKYCLCNCQKDGIDLITVVMTAPDSGTFSDAATLLSYGYSVSAYRDDNRPASSSSRKRRTEETVRCLCVGVWLDTDGNDISMVQKRISVPKEAEAPVVVGTKAGEAIYRLNGEQIGTVPILYASNVEKAFYRDYVKKAVTAFLL